MRLILITQRVEVVEGYNERRDCLDQNWIDFILKCGFLPILCPNNFIITKMLLKKVKISGIILSGGNDLCKYGGNAPERDILEKYLIEYSIENNIPLIGVCRGMQIILDYFNVKMIDVNNHIKSHHLLNYKNRKVLVNSYHSMGAIEANDDIYIDCKSEDGVLEKIMHNTYNIHGIMWHPERNIPFKSSDVMYFKEVFKERKKIL